MLETAWAAGIRYFETSPAYGLGLAETRLNGFLRERRRTPSLLSTKVGRHLQRSTPYNWSDKGHYLDVPARSEIVDTSRDGILRSLEQSLERLGVDTLDLVLCELADVIGTGESDAANGRLRDFLEGGYPALARLRDSGVVRAVGAMCSGPIALDVIVRRCDFDIIWLDDGLSLQDQSALDTLLPFAEENGIGVLVAERGMSLSGGIAGKPGGTYVYDSVPPLVLARADRLQRVCRSHGVTVAEAALAFPLGHKSVLSVIPAAHTPEEVRRNVAQLNVRIPAALWSDLKSERLIRPDTPVPL